MIFLFLSSNAFFQSQGSFLSSWFVILIRSQKFFSPTPFPALEFRLLPLLCAFYQKRVLRIQRHKSRELLYWITECSALWRNYPSSAFPHNNTSSPSEFRSENSLSTSAVFKNLRKGELFLSYKQKAGKLSPKYPSHQVPHSGNKVSVCTCTK